ncbi:MAG: hypothetical protein ACOC0C_09275 [Bacteroidota bacterium]
METGLRGGGPSIGGIWNYLGSNNLGNYGWFGYDASGNPGIWVQYLSPISGQDYHNDLNFLSRFSSPSIIPFYAVTNTFVGFNNLEALENATNGGGNGLLGDNGTLVLAAGNAITNMVRGSAELTQADALSKIKKANKLIANEKAAFKIFGKVASGAKFLGTTLGVVSLADHSTQAWSAFQNGDYRNGWINLGKVGVDATLMLLKSNPIVLTISVGYGIADAAGYLDF